MLGFVLWHVTLDVRDVPLSAEKSESISKSALSKLLFQHLAFVSAKNVFLAKAKAGERLPPRSVLFFPKSPSEQPT